jgi:predicted DNA-binding transcriptional regulator YafY
VPRWVADRGDRRLADAAGNALAKIAAVLPAELRHSIRHFRTGDGLGPHARYRASGAP